MLAIFRSKKFIVSMMAIVGIALPFYYFMRGDLYVRSAPSSVRDGDRPTIKEGQAQFNVERAHSLFLAGRHEAAISLLRDTAKQFPNEAVVHFMLGGYLYARDVKTIEAEKNPTMKSKLAKEATDNLRQSVELAPTVKEFRYSYATILADLGQHQTAIPEFDVIFADGTIRHHSKYGALVINYADSLAATGQKERALDEYRKSLAITPDYKLIADEYQKLLKAK